MITIPSRSWRHPVLGSWMHIGEHAVEWAERFTRHGGDLATDIETPGLDNAFTINCDTFAWRDPETYDLHSVLLDPRRNTAHHDLAREMYVAADKIILHNAPFDVPALWHSGLMRAPEVNRIVDTLLLARFAFPDTMIRKGLEALCVAHLGMTPHKGMEQAFKAAGYRTQTAGYEGMDVDAPVYRIGAMADTIATLKLEPLLRQMAITWTLDHPFADHGATTDAEAEDILGEQETNHRVMLRRTARGLAVDMDYLDRYREQVHAEQEMAADILASHGLEGGTGKGKALVTYLDSIGELPRNWPRTPTKQLKATKDLLDKLDHPLAAAQRKMADVEKVIGYLEKVARQAAVTGRCHPQVGVLGASATGRMSYSMPELQQFPKDARPIITDDGQGLTSIDWSQIEPVTMALMAKDHEFLAPFEAGADLYEPIQRAAGIDRPMAKVVLLATMYGQGPNGLALRIGHSLESAMQIRRQMLEAMPMSARWMAQVQGIADQYGKVITGRGRILPVDDGGSFRSVNYVVQGTAYDVLSHTIAEMERRGIGDHIQLAMHDEVVIDTPVAEEVQQIMLTPPPFLVRWSGRIPTLRTDLADMEHAWAKV